MKKFSDTLEQDRDFEFLGELFKWKLVHWSVLTAIVDEGRSGNGSEPKELSASEAVEELIELIPQFVDDDNDGVERMKKLLSGADKPVPIGQVNALYEWLLEVSSGRPTNPPSPSEAGRGRTAASSRGA